MTGGLPDLRPDEYLEPLFIAEYEATTSYVFSELMTANCLLVYLEKIEEYGECLSLLRPDELTFVLVLETECYAGLALRLWKILDKPLSQLLHRIRENLLPQYAAEYDALQASHRTTKHTMRAIQSRLEVHRNSRIAHLDLANPPGKLPPLPTSDLRMLFESTKAIFESLSPGTASLTLPLAYFDSNNGLLDVESMKPILDIDVALQGLIRHSDLVGDPENGMDPDNTFYRYLAAEERGAVNRCRVKCGLPPLADPS
jgi:hypothetical protein